ncbi:MULTISPECIES: hypothetical protein [Bradyrhizobium]|uniref:hypothetical protein n=1 Tax=Bradyrhizobium elkanii TaxID=29448 RepID=UPI000488F3BD|nr:hypothetical protein [Bradyrhizobium elkanii]
MALGKDSKVKFRKLIFVVAVAAVPSAALAQKTPNLDKETDAIKAVLWKKGMSTAPTQMYLAARADLLTEMCGRPKMDGDAKMYLRMSAVEAPAP